MGTARGRRGQGKEWGGAPFQAYQAQHLLYTLTWKLRGPLKGGFGFAFGFLFFNGGLIAQARLIKSLATSD